MAAGDLYRKIGFDASGAIKSLNNLSSALSSAKSALEQFQAAASRSSGGGLGNMSQQMSQAATTMVRFANGSRAAVTDLDSLVAAARRAQAGLPPLTNAIDKAGNAAKKSGGFFQRMQRTLTTIATTRLIIGSLTALTSAFRQAGKEATEFGLAIEEIQTIGQGLGLTTDELSQKVLALSSNLGTDALTTAEGLYQVLSNQVVEAGEEFLFLEEAQKLAITTTAEVGDAVDALSSIMNSYQLDVSATARVSDVLFKGVELGRFRLEEMGDIIGRVTGIAKEMGISFEEVVGSAALMTQSGVRIDTAFTQLRAIITKLAKPTEALKKLFKEWGVKDGPAAIAAFGGLGGVLDKLRQETNNSIPELSELFNEVRGLAGVMGLAVGDGKRFADVMTEIRNSTGVSAQAFEGFQSSQVKQLVIEMNKLKNAAIQLQTALIPLKLFFASFGTNFFTNLSKGIDVLTLSATEQKAKGADKFFQSIAAEAIKQRKELTRLNEEEYRKDKQQILANAAEQTAAYTRILDGITAKTNGAGNAFRGYLGSIVDSYEGAFKGLEKRIGDLSQEIKDSQKTISSEQQSLSDEQFRQELSRTQDVATQQKKILDRAYEEYWKGRNKASKAGLNQELQGEAKETLKRAESLFRDAANTRGSDGVTKAAERGILDAIQARIDGEKRYQTSAIKASQESSAALTKFKGNFEQVKAITEQLTKKSKELSEAFLKGDDKQADVLFQDIVKLEGQLKKLGFTASEVDFLKQFGTNTAEKFNQQVQAGLDKGTYDWVSAITALRDQLEKETFKFNASPEVVKAVGDPAALQAQAKTLGVAADPRRTPTTELAGEVFKASEEQLKRAQEQINNYNQALFETSKALSGLKELKAFTDLSADSTAANLEAQLTGTQKAAVGLARIFDRDLSEAVARAFLPQDLSPLISTFDTLSSAAEKLANDIAAGGAVTGEQLDALKEKISTATAASQLTDDQKVALSQYVIGLEKAADARTREVDAAKNLASAQAQTQAATQATQNLGDPLKAIELQTQVDQILNKTEALRQKNGELTTGYREATTAATGTANATTSIGTSASNAVGGVNQLTGSMQRLEQAALAAAQAQAAVQSAAAPGAFAGKYFASGGRGVDTIPAMIQKGEYVVNERSSRKFFSQLNAMNQGAKPVYRSEGGSVTNVGDVNVTVNGGDTSRHTVRAIASELNRELRRGTIRLGQQRRG